jgi:hypothetical protein
MKKQKQRSSIWHDAAYAGERRIRERSRPRRQRSKQMPFRTSKRTRWSMKLDRELIELSKRSTNLEAAAKHFDTTPEVISKMAKRLGLGFKSQSSPR